MPGPAGKEDTSSRNKVPPSALGTNPDWPVLPPNNMPSKFVAVSVFELIATKSPLRFDAVWARRATSFFLSRFHPECKLKAAVSLS